MKNDYTINVICESLGYNDTNNVVMYCPAIPSVGNIIIVVHKGCPLKLKVMNIAFNTVDQQIGVSGKFIQVNSIMAICELS